MTGFRRRFVVALLFLAQVLCGAPLLGQQLDGKGAARKPVVAVVGASVSAGFVNVFTDGPNERNRTIRLATALRAVWPREVAQVRNYSDVSMFLDPRGKGAVQLERTAKARPDLVVGVDFMFWYGYGRVAGQDAADRRAARLRLQAAALAQLSEVDYPLILGDYPDMAGADPRMIPPQLIPVPEVLDALNTRLRAWAETRPNVVLFPLAEWVARSKLAGDTIEFDGREVALPVEALWQTDLLHATRLGVALLAHRLQPHVGRALPAEHLLCVNLPVLATVLERSRTDVDVPEGKT